MKPTVARLVLFAGLFVLWLGYLGYLVATRPVTADNVPLVLSVPQIRASPLDVIAKLPAPGEAKDDVEVEIVEVLYPAEAAGVKAGDTIRVKNLAECRPLSRHPRVLPPFDWASEGEYLLPLRKADGPAKEAVRYEVMPIPPSPGFAAQGVTRIYPATGEARAQYRRIGK